MLRLPYMNSEPDSGLRRPYISVTVDSDYGYHAVALALEPHPSETIGDHVVVRVLTSDEARALAAALVHFADAADQR